VATAVDQLDAVGRLDLIMLDMAHPGRAAGQLRSLQSSRLVPVLLVSAHLRRTGEPSQALASQLGAAAVLPKPYTREQLHAAIAAALSPRA
jgi:DNA-binding response OmpR family regulator